IKLHVILGHPASAEALLERRPAPSPVYLTQPSDSRNRVFLVLDNETRHPILEHLRHRPAVESDDRSPTRQGFNHDQTERLRPVDGEKECGSAPQELVLLFAPYLTQEFHGPPRCCQ